MSLARATPRRAEPGHAGALPVPPCCPVPCPSPSAAWEQVQRAESCSPSRGVEEGTCACTPLLVCSGFSPKKVCEHHWREKQIRANSQAMYTDATLSFHSVTPSVKPFTIYALLLRACVFNHFSQHSPVSLALLDCSLGVTALFREGTLLSTKAERWPLQGFGKGRWGKAIKGGPK